DDGRGIDAAAVRRKAAANGLVDPGLATTMPDEEAIGLIFAPGFSTLDTVSDLSGRGIGMYAVRAAAEKAGGSVDLRSRAGTGTSVFLRLPLGMAVMRVVVVAVGRHRFGVPIDVVSESVRLRRDRIVRIGRRDTFVLHDRIVPLYRLKDLLNLPDEDASVPGPVSPEGDVRILVAETGGNPGAVEVDGFEERIDVVLKPMEGLLADIPGYLGTTVLGNGQVLLVLDLKEILR
ncbi:MAG TPA: chemotaxis protein CheW, partial [Arenibaculum sp.]|nr:chemotaxis protein CheW [Arenibaculum sp.]